MDLSEYARSELERAGLFKEDSDYDGMLGTAVMELVETFAKQGHSGYSAHCVIDLFSTVASYKPLEPITSDPDEWFMPVDGVWQSKRRPSTFSRDGGKTWYDIQNKKLNNGDRWVRDPIRRRLRGILRFS